MKSTDQATRCPSCKTVFRVVPDQLRVSEGWVRCGRCTNVFNAAENMMDMDGGWTHWSEGSAEDAADGLADGLVDGAHDDAWHAAGEGSAPSSTANHFSPPPDAPTGSTQPDSGYLSRSRSHRARQDGPVAERLASKIEAAIWRSQQPAVAPGEHSTRPLVAASSPRPLVADSSARPRSPWQAPSGDAGSLAPAPPAAPLAPHTPGVLQPQAGMAATGPPSLFDETRPESLWPQTAAMPGLEALRAEDKGRAVPGAAMPSQAPKPGFMRQAERNLLWRRPHLRALLLGAVVGSALLLLAQVGMAYRDLLAARHPGLKPVLQSLCAGLGCTVQAARSIDSLAVESSGLVRVDKLPLYKLQVTLRNRANLELALPALDVTFTDSKGDVISRKVLLAQDLSSTIDQPPGDHGGALAAGREVTLQGTLQTSSSAPETVAGYTVELFYP